VHVSGERCIAAAGGGDAGSSADARGIDANLVVAKGMATMKQNALLIETN
jgi:hypothetical protein